MSEGQWEFWRLVAVFTRRPELDAPRNDFSRGLDNGLRGMRGGVARGRSYRVIENNLTFLPTCPGRVVILIHSCGPFLQAGLSPRPQFHPGQLHAFLMQSAVPVFSAACLP